MKKNAFVTVLILVLLVLAGASVPAQEAGETGEPGVDERLEAREVQFENLLESALDSAEAGNWDMAFDFLDTAETFYPDDPRIQSYRASFLELSALDEAQSSWNTGTPSEVADTAGTDGTTGEENSENASGEEEPRFAIDRGDRDPRESPILTRDRLRAEIGLKTFAVDPYDSYGKNTWNSPEEFFYASLGVDVAYWMPFMRRSLGLAFRSNGYSCRPGDPSQILNSLDLGLNIRGFLAESKTSRLEIGLDFGGAVQSNIAAGGRVDRSGSLYLGLWASDPLFFHLFTADSLENLLFTGGIRIYSSFSEEIFEMVNYRLDASWVFLGGHVGIRLEWWDFAFLGTRTNMMSLALIGGYRF